MIRNTLTVAAALTLAAGTAHAQTAWLSEVLANPPGGTDLGRERLEFTGQPGTTLTGWKLILIEADIVDVNDNPLPVGQRQAGNIDEIFDLSNVTLGTNGVALLVDGTAVVLPAPAAGTAVINVGPLNLENGGYTYVLGFGTLPPEWIEGADLDLNDDGTLDTPIGAAFTVVDAVGYVNGDFDGITYASQLNAQLGSLDVPRQLSPFSGALWTPDAIYRWRTAAGGPAFWVGGDILGSGNGPYLWDGPENFGFGPTGFTPGPSGTVGTIGPDFGSLNRQLAPVACPADCDASGSLSPADFTCFLNKYRAGGLGADCDASGALSPADFTCFLGKYRAGCP
jgi:hypothetical protein